MKRYFFIAQSMEGLFKSGVLRASSYFKACNAACRLLHDDSGDEYKLIHLEAIE